MKDLRILLVEDSQIDADLILYNLKKVGYNPFSERVEDEVQMRDALENETWDLVIADYRLPQFNAPTALSLLQRTGLEIPFIVVSGAIGEEEAVELMKAGASDFLKKDNLARLGPAIERELADAQVRKARKAADQALHEKMIESSRRALELEMITEVSTSLRRAQTRKELVEILLSKLVKLLNARFATLAFLVENQLVFENSLGNLDTWHGQSLPANLPIFQQILVSGNPQTIKNSENSSTEQLPDWLFTEFPVTEALIIYPLRSGRSSVGLIVLGMDHVDQLAHEQSNLLTAVGEMAGNAFNRMLATEELESIIQKRDKELEDIYQITAAASRSLDILQASKKALKLILDSIHADSGKVFFFDDLQDQSRSHIITCPEIAVDDQDYIDHLPQSLIQAVLQQKQAIIIPDQNVYRKDDSGISTEQSGTAIGLPLKVQERLLGVLLVYKSAEQQITMDELTLLSFIADHLGMVIENNLLFRKAEKTAILDERSRLARELHDSVTQLLYSANLYSAGASRFIKSNNYQMVADYLVQIGELTQQALRDMRLLVFQLRSPELIQSGLITALQNRLDSVERRSGIDVEVVLDEVPGLPNQVEDNLYRIAIEALNNATKHAGATSLLVQLVHYDQRLELKIKDNGCGFDPTAIEEKGGFGLTSIKERAKIINAEFNIFSKKSRGTEVIVSVPEKNLRDFPGKGGDD